MYGDKIILNCLLLFAVFTRVFRYKRPREKKRMERKRRLSLSVSASASQPSIAPTKTPTLRLHGLLVDILHSEIKQGLAALETRQRQGIERKLEQRRHAIATKTRPQHLQLLDELQRLQIDSQQPIQSILQQVPVAERASLPIFVALQRQWTAYKAALYKANRDRLVHTQRESPAYFERAMANLTFSRVFSNTMWPDADSHDVHRDQFPILETDPDWLENEHVLLERNMASAYRDAKDAYIKEMDALLRSFRDSGGPSREDIAGYVDAMVAHADSQARYEVVDSFVQGAFTTYYDQTLAFLARSITSLEAYALCGNIPQIQVVETLELLCKELRTQWLQVIAEDTAEAEVRAGDQVGDQAEATHAEVVEFLQRTQQHIDKLTVQYKPVFAELTYDAEYEATLDLHTKLGRVECLRDTLRGLSETTAQFVRDHDHLLRLAVVPVTGDRDHDREKKARSEQGFGPLTAFLHSTHQDYETKVRVLQQAVAGEVQQGSPLERQLNDKRNRVLTAALHLDFVDWVASLLAAIGPAFMVAEDVPGQLKQRVQMAIMDSKGVPHAHIDKVLKQETEMREKRRTALAPELSAAVAWLRQDLEPRFQAIRTQLLDDVRSLKANVKTRVFTLHPDWMHLSLPANERNPAQRLFAVYFQSTSELDTENPLVPTARRRQLDQMHNEIDPAHMEAVAQKLLNTSILILCMVYALV